MKKKISLFVCVILAALCFTGCSAKKDNTEYDVAAMEETVDVVLTSFTTMSEEDFEQYKDLTRFQLNYVMMNSGLRIEAEDFLNMIDSWEAIEKECGTYVSHEKYIVDAGNAGVEITTKVKFEGKDVTLSFSFTEDSYLKSLDISGSSALNKILKTPGVDKILYVGIGAVVLIFLAIRLIPQYFTKFGKNTDAEVHEDGANTETSETALVNDLELVAVITAAIAAQRGTTTDGFVVRSIRRRPSNKWR